MYAVKQASTGRSLFFQMIDSTDNTSPKTGLTPTVTLSKNGAAFAAPAGTISEVGSGWYQVAGNATDTNTLGILLLHATAAGAVPTDETFEVLPALVGDAVSLAAGQNVATVGGQAPPANWASMAITGGGAVTVATNNDKTGYTASASNLPGDYARNNVSPSWYNVSPSWYTAPTNADTSGVATLLTRIPSAFTFTAGNVNAAAQNFPASVTVGGYSAGQDPATLVTGATLETGETLAQTLKLIRAILAGKATVTGSTVVFSRKDGSTVAFTITSDSSGNRTSPTVGTL